MVEFLRPGFPVLLACIVLPACSTTSSNTDEYIVQDLSPREEVICKRYRPVGTHIPVKVCRTRAQMEADQQAAMRQVGPLRTMGGDEPRRPPN